MSELSLADQDREIRAEFIDESERAKTTPDPLTRLSALQHIDALLDAHNIIRVQLEGQGNE